MVSTITDILTMPEETNLQAQFRKMQADAREELIYCLRGGSAKDTADAIERMIDVKIATLRAGVIVAARS